MKAIKIDVVKREIYEVEVDPSNLKTLYEQMECECFCIGARLPENDVVLVDDEGMIIEPDQMIGGFTIPLFSTNMLAGHGLVTGGDDEGNSVDVKVPLGVLRTLVHWKTADEVREYSFHLG